ncbi:Uncharacterised protein [Enterococcus malodoratus]|uniref:Uncharacterized protein n=1 Tax=Enterococcus malodoratus ATCC 43197 TaxID=1158601 RepID=R2NW15_9ENTE|nr:hypothetical protein UAI_03005 [Enterococcus malodoratus ATCC 43197]EOT66665.1 hypothetical protein I585_02186 [Enterococcus malodoratus ATCC 43197]SPW90687.1 Uncharacterised protein [Enterococcus malodoratus]STD70082.1 Uncharacterised protein [Enterococcus malodoratus]
MKKLLFPFFAVSYLLAHITLHMSLYPIDWLSNLFNK